jgi:hypothetical protein
LVGVFVSLSLSLSSPPSLDYFVVVSVTGGRRGGGVDL